MIFVFLLSLAYQLIIPLFFPFLKLSYFAPFLVIVRLKSSISKALLSSFGIGLLLDLLNTSTPFGFYALVMTLTMLFLSIFNIEHFFSRPLATFIVSLLLFVWIQTSFEQAVAAIFKLNTAISLKWILSDLIIFPLVDLLYGWLAVYLPLRARLKK